MTPDLKQLQELLALPHEKPHGRDYGCWCSPCYEAEVRRIALADLLIEQAPALLASHEALSAEKWEQGSLLASTTDLLNTWARESNVTEAQNEKGIRDLADRLWSKLSGELCAQRRQIEALSAEVAGLRKDYAELECLARLREDDHDRMQEKLREDKARLDWLEGDAIHVIDLGEHHGPERWEIEFTEPECAYGDTLRAAIDAARQEKKDA